MTAQVLIVDDDRQNRELLAIMLASERFRVLTAASGEEALASVTRDRPDIVLLDVMLPGLDGYQVAARIKCDAATRHIPIILITGLDDFDARARGQRAGAEEFLSRPVDRADLCLRIRQLLPPAAATS